MKRTLVAGIASAAVLAAPAIAHAENIPVSLERNAQECTVKLELFRSQTDDPTEFTTIRIASTHAGLGAVANGPMSPGGIVVKLPGVSFEGSSYSRTIPLRDLMAQFGPQGAYLWVGTDVMKGNALAGRGSEPNHRVPFACAAPPVVPPAPPVPPVPPVVPPTPPVPPVPPTPPTPVPPVPCKPVAVKFHKHGRAITSSKPVTMIVNGVQLHGKRRHAHVGKGAGSIVAKWACGGKRVVKFGGTPPHGLG